MTPLDTLDRQLIAILREDGRAPVSKLAQVLGVTRATVQNRLDRLQTNGAIAGFTIRGREDLGPGSVHAIMMIAVAGPATDKVIRRLRGLPEMRQLHSTNGKWDLVAHLVAGDLPAFDAALREVRMIDGVTHSETSIMLRPV